MVICTNGVLVGDGVAVDVRVGIGVRVGTGVCVSRGVAVARPKSGSIVTASFGPGYGFVVGVVLGGGGMQPIRTSANKANNHSFNVDTLSLMDR